MRAPSFSQTSLTLDNDTATAASNTAGMTMIAMAAPTPRALPAKRTFGGTPRLAN